MQETKVTNEQLEFHPSNYYEYLYPAIKKGYSGTLIYTKTKPLNIKYGIDIPEYDDEGRVITLEYDNFYLVNVYVPNVKRDLSRMESRMLFDNSFRSFLQELNKTKPVIVCGDFNVAHEETDLKNPKSNVGNAGFTYEERNKFTELLESGFIDTFRYYNPNSIDNYTWWSYRANVREKNIGWRIDYFLVSNRIINGIKDVTIYKDIYGSDHCPIGIDID
jgi:exodeoxyribonuclease-3